MNSFFKCMLRNSIMVEHIIFICTSDSAIFCLSYAIGTPEGSAVVRDKEAEGEKQNHKLIECRFKKLSERQCLLPKQNLNEDIAIRCLLS